MESQSKGEEVAAPGTIASGAAGTGQEEKINAGPGSGRIPPWCTGKILPGRHKRSVQFPVLHYFGVCVRIRAIKREYRTGRAVACRGERG